MSATFFIRRREAEAMAKAAEEKKAVATVEKVEAKPKAKKK